MLIYIEGKMELKKISNKYSKMELLSRKVQSRNMRTYTKLSVIPKWMPWRRLSTRKIRSILSRYF